MRHHRRRSAVAVAAIAGLLFTACSGGEEASDTDSDTGDATTADETTTASEAGGDSGDTGDGSESGSDSIPAASTPVIVQTGPEPSQGFDPAIAATDASRLRMDLMFARLLEYDKGGEIVGALAEDWQASDDGLTWTFTLRDTAAFSDGSPVTASDVVFSFEYLQQGEVTASLFPEIAEMRAEDDHTVVIELAAPAGQILLNAILRDGTAGIISEAAVTEAGGPEEYFTNPTATSGPFALEEYVPGSEMRLVANEHFWREGYPKAQGLHLVFTTDAQAQLVGLDSGEYDIVPVPYEDVSSMQDDAAVTTYSAEQIAPTFYGVNRTTSPFDSQDVRQAVAYAVDRQGARDACWFGTGLTSYGGNLIPSDPAYTDVSTYDVARDEAVATAAGLLESAGWVEGPDGVRVAEGVEGAEDGTPLSFEVVYESNWPAAECNTLIQQQALAEVGVDAVPTAYDPASYYGDAAKGAFSMWHGGAAASNGLELYTNWFQSGGVLTPLTTQLDMPDIDARIEEAATAVDPAESAAIISELEEWQADFVPMITIGHQWFTSASHTGLQDYWAGWFAGSRGISEAYLAE